MAFISPNLTKHNIQFLTGHDLGSDHIPIETSLDAQPHRNTHTSPIRYKFDQTDREVFESTLEAPLSSGNISELKSTKDIDTYADFIVTAIRTAVDKAIPTSKSGRPDMVVKMVQNSTFQNFIHIQHLFIHIQHLYVFSINIYQRSTFIFMQNSTPIFIFNSYICS